MTNLQASQDTARVSQTNRNSTTAAAWTEGQSVVEYCSYIINHKQQKYAPSAVQCACLRQSALLYTCAQVTEENAKNSYTDALITCKS